MKKWGIAAVAGLCAVGVLFAACGGGGDDDNNSKTPSTTKTVVKKTGTATAKTSTSGTPGAEGTGAAGTPGATGTVGTNGGTPPPAGTTAVPGQTTTGDASPQAAPTFNSSNPYLAPAPTPSDAEREVGNPDSGIDPEFAGGDPSTPPRVVTDLPPVPSGATIDPPTIAAPNVSTGDLEFIIDANASEPGIQSSRTITVGDVIRVGVVLTNVPAEGLSAFSFQMLYDISKVVAPTIEGGSSLGRNPDINEIGLNGAAILWDCLLPAPNGDADEVGGYSGDGDPSTGQAVIGCYSIGAELPSGTVVLATVQFQAIAAGTAAMTLTDDDRTTSTIGSLFETLGDCGFLVPLACRSATITVTN